MDEGSLFAAVGMSVRRRREASGWSQEAFADSIGMHRAYYGQIERGKRNLTLATLLRVSNGLGIRLSAILHEAEKSLGSA